MWALAGAAILIAVGTIGGVVTTSGSNQAAQAAQAEPPPNTATVQEGKLSATVSQNGTLTYQGQPDGSPYTVINQDQGTYTQLPVLGQVITQGQVLYRVNDSPVVLLHGTIPAYRTLTTGSTGADVAELNSDLVTLGYATSAQLSPTSDSFDSATTTAVEKLQAALGMTQNGTLILGQAIFEPAALRITSLTAQWGGSAQSGQTALQATSTTRVVQVALDASEQTEVAVGDTVTITLPNNQTTLGVVSSIGAVATCPSNSSQGSSGSSSTSAAPGTDSCSSGNPSSATPTITVDVTPSDPAATGTWDQAPVQVGITTASVPNALAVPVTALLAQSGGGYSVEVVDAAGTDHLVAVSLGLFDDAKGLVQVTGSGLAAGQKVVVPST
jgi:Putative peptidoglycan binding domain